MKRSKKRTLFKSGTMLPAALVLAFTVFSYGQQNRSASDGDLHILPVRGNIYMLVGAGANVTLSDSTACQRGQFDAHSRNDLCGTALHWDVQSIRVVQSGHQRHHQHSCSTKTDPLHHQHQHGPGPHRW